LDDIILIKSGLGVIVVLILLPLLVDDNKDELVKDIEGANLGSFTRSIKISG
jgi:hypothetical protein